jgi:hypothetical protein
MRSIRAPRSSRWRAWTKRAHSRRREEWRSSLPPFPRQAGRHELPHGVFLGLPLSQSSGGDGSGGCDPSHCRARCAADPVSDAPCCVKAGRTGAEWHAKPHPALLSHSRAHRAIARLDEQNVPRRRLGASHGAHSLRTRRLWAGRSRARGQRKLGPRGKSPMERHACWRKLQKLCWAGCPASLLLCGAAYGQASSSAPNMPPPAQPTVPAEIQPGHPAIGNAAPHTPAREPAPSPQTAFPSSQPEGREKGVIRPPVVGDTGVKTPPKSSVPATPVIPPPGSPGGNQNVGWIRAPSSPRLGCGNCECCFSNREAMPLERFELGLEVTDESQAAE